MSKLSNNALWRILADILIVFCIYNAPWYVTGILLLVAGLFFFPYFEMIPFGAILDVYYGDPKRYLCTIVAMLYFIALYILQKRIFWNTYVTTSKKKI